MSAFNLEGIDPSAVKKIKCRECGHEDFVLFEHVKHAHGMTPEQYQEKHGADASLISEIGKKVAAMMQGATPANGAIKEKGFGSKAVFGVGFGKDGETPKDIKGYEGYTAADGVPELDPNYVFQPDATRDALMGMMAPRRKPIYLKGPTGSGKTSLPEQMAARLGRPYTQVQFHQEMEVIELTGNWTIGEGGQMVYLYSALAQALQKPSLVVLDEFDSGNPGVSAIANALLDGKPLVLGNKGGEKIIPHKDCIIFATGNTNGMGDETGLYASTSNQSFATMNRFGMTVVIDYMPDELEVSLLRRVFPKMPEAECRDMVKVAKLVRDAFKGGKVTVVLSTRQIINWGQWVSMTGNQKRGFDLAFGNQLGGVDKGVITEFFQRVFGTRSST